MTDHKTGTREEWLAARLELLQAEKELTRRSDELARRRQELPWVRIDKEYRFETDERSASLKDLFRGRSQLLVYDFMFGPDYQAGCPSCTAIADGFNGIAVHLANHDVMLWAVSRAPLAKLQAYKRRMGWTFPWTSSFGSDFNFDFNVWFTEEQWRKGVEYNYRREAVVEWRAGQEGGGEGAEAQFAAMCGTDVATYHRERPGMSTSALEDGVVYHAYSTYARGLDGLWGMYQWLDRAPQGAPRDEPLVAPPRRVRQALSAVNEIHINHAPVHEGALMASKTSRTMIAALQVSLDGFTQGPHGEKDWVDSWADAIQLIPDVDTFVLGGRMYPDYGEYWESIYANPERVPPSQERIASKSEIAYARLAAATPHVVLSTTLKSVSWPTGQIIRDVAELRTLKGQPGKNMYVVGGATLVASLLNEDLIDELRLIVHPVVLGKGQALFGGVNKRLSLDLIEAKSTESGTVVVTYRT